ncbi:MAG: hypothetical protein IAF38_15950 [Bacteroidia bacterium]|nr:hypothetical protein [Bacteroidia bacterium]
MESSRDKILFTKRNLQFVNKVIETLSLSLKNLTVITECASGPFAYTPVAALLAGANVISLGRDTRYGKYEENKKNLEEIISLADPALLSKIQFTDVKESIRFNEIDIFTNSGLIRPITKEIIDTLKPTCVIPLMWETWEFRESDLDIIACQQNNIPVIGTNEYFPPTDMTLTIGLFGVKILFDMKIPVANCRVVLIGGKIPANQIAQLYEKMGIDFTWFSPSGKEREKNCYPYSQLKKIKELKHIDAFVCAEHTDPFLIAGKNGGITFEEIYEAHPLAWWGHIVGNVDAEDLKNSGLSYYPEIIMPFGHQTYGTENLGFAPVIQLNMCGLKVGEIAAKERLKGSSIEVTIKKTLEYGIGQDFEGGFLQFKPKKS